MKKGEFAARSKAEQVYQCIAEFPGVRVTTAEIAAECAMGSHLASCYAHTLFKRGLVHKDAQGRGSKAVYWVEA